MKEAKNILIIGKKGVGKSQTGWEIMQAQHAEGRPAFMYRCPQPQLLKKVPFKVDNITTLNQLFHLRDSVCIVDEANIHFDAKNKQINDDLKQILQLSRQNNTTFIFIVHNSYVFNRGLFAYIDIKIIKETNEGHWELERPHMKTLYQSIRPSGKENAYVDSEEFKGYTKCHKLEWYTDEFSNMYRTPTNPTNLTDAI